jgi:sporulation protein YlmC with PRC-barrel domain
MIRKLLATTAIATLVATGAYAQTAPAPAAPMEQTAAPEVIHADGHLATNIIGQTVYNSAGEDAENIGSVNDLVVASDGNVEAIVVGVGGFLGIGQKNVALEYDLVEWAERDGNQWLIVPTNREALEALEEFDTAAYRPMPADAQVGNTSPASAEQLGVAPATSGTDTSAATPAAPANDSAAAVTPAAPAGDTTAAAPSTDPATAPGATDDTMTSAIDRSTLTDVDVTGLSADKLIGTTVYGADDENVGSISDVILATDGKGVEAVIMDVGGFLGIGSKSVAVGMDNLAFMADADGNNYLYTQFTREQLEAQPEYDASSFASNRDDQLLIVPAQ